MRDPLPYLRKPRIAVGVISYEGQYHGRHMDSVTNLYKMDTGYEINVIKIEGAICSKGRNGIAREAMAWGAEALLFIDDDISFLSLIHISEPTRPRFGSRMPSSA